MKISEQCGIAASKGNQILGLIRITITYKEKHLERVVWDGNLVKSWYYLIRYLHNAFDKLSHLQHGYNIARRAVATNFPVQRISAK